MTIYRSPFPVAAPSQDGVFDFMFTNNPDLDRSKTAVIDAVSGEETSYGKLISEALRFGNGLRTTAGLKYGDTILIFSPNSASWPVFVFAAVASGITISTANSSYTSRELAHQISEASAVLVLVGSDLAGVAKDAVKELGMSEECLYVLPGVDGKVVPQGLKSYLELRGEEAAPVKIPPGELATRAVFLPFSSGTTAKPKGVQISHANLTSTLRQVCTQDGFFNKGEIVMGVLPLYHIYGLVVLLCETLYRGGTLILLPGQLDLIKFCETIQKYRATLAFIVPPIALGLAKHPAVPKFDLSSIRYFLSGAAPLSADLQNILASRLKGDTLVCQGYGMTETTSIALIPDIHDVRSGSCGKLLPGMEARLVDEEGKDVAEGEGGELWLRGPNIMIQYHKNPEATAQTITKEGWLKTGDVCVRSKDGHFTIVDRRKEFIKYKGFQVIPSELEAILVTCPLVADAGVIGHWAEDQATELPRAYVVIDPKHVHDKDIASKIAKYVAGKVAPHKKLRGGVFPVDAIPKSAAGKILRKDLRTLAAKEESKSKL